MTAPTQLWSPGSSDGEAARRYSPRPGGIAHPRLPARGIELAPRCVTAFPGATFPVAAPSRRPLALLAVMLVTFAVVCGLVMLGQAAAALSEVPQQTSVVRVGAGETVWDVAQRVAPGSDVRAVVAQIRELNGMSDSAVEAGVPLRVPDGR